MLQSHPFGNDFYWDREHPRHVDIFSGVKKSTKQAKRNVLSENTQDPSKIRELMKTIPRTENDICKSLYQFFHRRFMNRLI